MLYIVYLVWYNVRQGRLQKYPRSVQPFKYHSKHGKNIHTPPKGGARIFVQLVRGVPLIPPAFRQSDVKRMCGGAHILKT